MTIFSSFQSRVRPWIVACLGQQVASDKVERTHRFLEEALELAQACGCTQDESYQLVDYVYGRDVGQISQEIGGVMVTLAALCLAFGVDMHADGETELARVWTKVETIRAKHFAKPRFSALPAASVGSWTHAARDVLAERRRQIEKGWTTAHDDEHDMGQIALAAASYAIVGAQRAPRPACLERPWAAIEVFSFSGLISYLWPWQISFWKPRSPREDLVRAGALILAEIERLDRAEGAP